MLKKRQMTWQLSGFHILVETKSKHFLSVIILILRKVYTSIFRSSFTLKIAVKVALWWLMSLSQVFILQVEKLVLQPYFISWESSGIYFISSYYHQWLSFATQIMAHLGNASLLFTLFLVRSLLGEGGSLYCYGKDYNIFLSVFDYLKRLEKYLQWNYNLIYF